MLIRKKSKNGRELGPVSRIQNGFIIRPPKDKRRGGPGVPMQKTSKAYLHENLQSAIEDLRMASTRLGISESFEEEAVGILKKAVKISSIKKHSTKDAIAAVLYIVAEEHTIPIMLFEASVALNARVKEVYLLARDIIRIGDKRARAPCYDRGFCVQVHRRIRQKARVTG